MKGSYTVFIHIRNNVITECYRCRSYFLLGKQASKGNDFVLVKYEKIRMQPIFQRQPNYCSFPIISIACDSSQNSKSRPRIINNDLIKIPRGCTVYIYMYVFYIYVQIHIHIQYVYHVYITVAKVNKYDCEKIIAIILYYSIEHRIVVFVVIMCHVSGIIIDSAIREYI